MTKAKLAWFPLYPGLVPLLPSCLDITGKRGQSLLQQGVGKKVLINKVFTDNFLVFTQFYLYASAAASNDWRVVKTFIGFSGIDKIYEDPVDILWEPGLDIFTAKLCPSVRVRVFFDERSEH